MVDGIQGVFCSACDAEFDEGGRELADRKACLQCGSVARTVKAQFTANIGIESGLQAMTKSPAERSRWLSCERSRASRKALAEKSITSDSIAEGIGMLNA